MNIELEAKCRANPNNKVKFGMDSMAHSVSIETIDGSQTHYISMSRHEFDVIARVLMSMPYPDPMEQMRQAYKELPADCKVNPV